MRFQHRQDLSLSFKDDENEFQSCCIGIINDLDPNTTIGCYRYPKKSSNNKFLKELKATLTTRMIAGQRPNLVDNIFTNIFEKSLNSGILTDKITDHLPNFLFILDFIDQQKNKQITIRNMKAFNEETYLEDLDSLKSLNYIDFANVNELYNEFHSKLIAVIDKNAPYKTLSKQESKTKQKPSITKSIIKSIIKSL